MKQSKPTPQQLAAVQRQRQLYVSTIRMVADEIWSRAVQQRLAPEAAATEKK